MSYKKHSIILVPTKDITSIFLIGNWDKLYSSTNIDSNDFNKDESYQHLYVISDEEIKNKDWYLNEANEVFQAGVHIYVSMANELDSCRKIIATTNKLFTLPQIPSSFIHTYILNYNKGNKINEVTVGYTQLSVKGNYSNTCSICKKVVQNVDKLCFVCKICGLILSTIKNTINIKSIKTTYTKDEVEVLCRKAYVDGQANYIGQDTWINKHL